MSGENELIVRVGADRDAAQAERFLTALISRRRGISPASSIPLNWFFVEHPT